MSKQQVCAGDCLIQASDSAYTKLPRSHISKAHTWVHCPSLSLPLTLSGGLAAVTSLCSRVEEDPPHGSISQVLREAQSAWLASQLSGLESR